MMAAFRRRRDLALALLRAVGAEVVEPEGAFYLFIRVGMASAADPAPGTRFADHLLESNGVAIVPGTAFQAPEWVRLSYAASEDHVLEGVRQVIDALRI